MEKKNYYYSPRIVLTAIKTTIMICTSVDNAAPGVDEGNTFTGYTDPWSEE